MNEDENLNEINDNTVNNIGDDTNKSINENVDNINTEDADINNNAEESLEAIAATTNAEEPLESIVTTTDIEEPLEPMSATADIAEPLAPISANKKSNIKVILGSCIAAAIVLAIIGFAFAGPILSKISPTSYAGFVYKNTQKKYDFEQKAVASTFGSNFKDVNFKDANKVGMGFSFSNGNVTIPAITYTAQVDDKSDNFHISLGAEGITTLDVFGDKDNIVAYTTNSHKYSVPRADFGKDLLDWLNKNNFNDIAKSLDQLSSMNLQYNKDASKKALDDYMETQSKILSDLLEGKTSKVTVDNGKSNFTLNKQKVDCKTITLTISGDDFKKLLLTQRDLYVKYISDQVALAYPNDPAKAKQTSDIITSQYKSVDTAINALTLTKVNLVGYVYKDTFVGYDLNIAGSISAYSQTQPFDVTLSFDYDNFDKMFNGWNFIIKSNTQNASVNFVYTGENYSKDELNGTLSLLTSGMEIGGITYKYTFDGKNEKDNGKISAHSIGSSDTYDLKSSLIDDNHMLYFDITTDGSLKDNFGDANANFSIGTSTDPIVMPVADYKLFDTSINDIKKNEEAVISDLVKKFQTLESEYYNMTYGSGGLPTDSTGGTSATNGTGTNNNTTAN